MTKPSILKSIIQDQATVLANLDFVVQEQIIVNQKEVSQLLDYAIQLERYIGDLNIKK